MKYNFSANFLKIQNPDTSFGQAWESLCFDLLKAEYKDNSQIRFRAPDKGIDIYRQTEKIAYQCKSNELALHGTIDISECIKSIKAALTVKETIIWDKYFIATNSNFSGNGFDKLQSFKKDNSLKDVEQLGPEFWSELCDKHIDVVKDKLDFRLLVTEQQVIEALIKARYYDKFIQQHSAKISSEKYSVEITNNQTPLQLKIPFSPELTIENLLDVVKGLLNINMDRNNYADTQTSALPSISLTFKGSKQSFSKKIKDITDIQTPKFEFWITIIWKDEIQKESSESDIKTMQYIQLFKLKKFERGNLSLDQRKQITIDRTKQILQSMIWDGANSITKAYRSGLI